MGSPGYATDTGSAMNCSYSISKAGLNMAVTKFAIAERKRMQSEMEGENVAFMGVSPGLVKTMQGSE